MAGLWGYENLPQPTRRRDPLESAADIAQTLAQGYSNHVQQANAREMALKRLAMQEAQRQDANERSRAMLAMQGRGMDIRESEAGQLSSQRGLAETAREEAQTVAPFTGTLKTLPVSSHTAPIRSRLEAMQGNPEIRSSGQVPGERFVPAPSFTGEEGGTDAPVPVVPDMSVAQKTEAMGPEIQRAIAATEAEKQANKVKQIGARPAGSGLSFEQRVALQNNKGRIDSIIASAKAKGSKLQEVIMARLFKADQALQQGNVDESNALIDAAEQIVNAPPPKQGPGGITIRKPVQGMLPKTPGPTVLGKVTVKMPDGSMLKINQADLKAAQHEGAVIVR